MKRFVLCIALLFTMVLSVSMLFASESKCPQWPTMLFPETSTVTMSSEASNISLDVVNYNYINEFSTSHDAGRLFVEASSNCGGCHKAH